MQAARHTERIQLVATPGQVAAWRQHAAGVGLSLSAWLRISAMAAMRDGGVAEMVGIGNSTQAAA